MGEPRTAIPPELDSPAWVDEYNLSLDLHVECPLRLLGFWHFQGRYRHFQSPTRPGKVLCCHAATLPLEGAVPTDAQQRLDDALARREAAGKGGAG